MLKIQNLLNPSPSPDHPASSTLRPQLKTAYVPHLSAPTPSPTPKVSMTSSGQKTRSRPAKDAPVFTRSPTRGQVNFAPFECTERPSRLDSAACYELRDRQKVFRIFPSGGEEGLIGDYVNRIPYNSEKKTFFSKTGRDRFELFQYTFTMPDSAKEYTVMWDYQNGLVRITPFFKACGYQKTTPNKVLTINPGLRDITHSITGGAIVAQGYWMPYHCARAVCTTFCWNIRWALTPMFGPNFLKDCLPPTHPNFADFRISEKLIQDAADVFEQLRELNRDDTPSSAIAGQQISPPRSEPEPAVKTLRARTNRPSMRIGSPFSSDYSVSTSSSDDRSASPLDSPLVSPKSQESDVRWDAMDRSNGPPSPLSNVSAGVVSRGGKIHGQKRLDFNPSLFRPSPPYLNSIQRYHQSPYLAAPTSTPESSRATPAKSDGKHKRVATAAPAIKLNNGSAPVDDHESESESSNSTVATRDDEGRVTNPNPAKKQKIAPPGQRDYTSEEWNAALALLQLAAEDRRFGQILRDEGRSK